MTIEKNKSYWRHNPGGQPQLIEPKTDRDVKWHQSLVDDGYEYEKV